MEAVRVERLGDTWYHAIAVGSLSWSYFILGEARKAIRAAVNAIVEAHALRDVSSTTITLAPAARVAVESGLPEEAAILLGSRSTRRSSWFWTSATGRSAQDRGRKPRAFSRPPASGCRRRSSPG